MNILNQPALDADNYGLRLAYYGLCLVKQGNQRNGLKHLDEATRIRNLRATFLTRIHRAQAEAYFDIGDIESAIQSCELAALIARENGLKGQLRKALKQRQQAASNKSFERSQGSEFLITV